MFRLHGSPISNFYNIVKVAMLEKGMDFEEVAAYPSRNEEFLAMSPMGKIPVLEVREGYLTETQVIVEFLEEIYPELSLYPRDPFQRALARRIAHMSEVYIDVPMRPVMVAAMTGKSVPEPIAAEARNRLGDGLAALARIARPDPWLIGEEFGMADIFGYYCLSLVEGIARDQLQVDVFERLPGFFPWKQAVAARDFVAEVDRAHADALRRFHERRS